MENNNYFVHESSVIDDKVAIGENTKIWHFSHVLSGSIIGDNCVLGQNVMVGPNVKIGNNCKIQNNISIYNSVELEDDVFCGPSCVFTNVNNPRAFIERKDEFSKTIVKKGATIGANATIVCGVTLGAYCFVGAGALVNKDIPDYALVVGVPFNRIGWVCKCGKRIKLINEFYTCEFCKKNYLEKSGFLCPKEN